MQSDGDRVPVVNYVNKGDLIISDGEVIIIHQPLLEMPNHFYALVADEGMSET